MDDKLVRLSDVIETVENQCSDGNMWGNENLTLIDARKTIDELSDIPAVDAVEVETVFDIIIYLMGDYCPCNFSPIDEWLPEACELIDECPSPSDKRGCWKQFIKHYSTRLDYMDTAAMEAEQERMEGEEEHNETD